MAFPKNPRSQTIKWVMDSSPSKEAPRVHGEPGSSESQISAPSSQSILAGTFQRVREMSAELWNGPARSPGNKGNTKQSMRPPGSNSSLEQAFQLSAGHKLPHADSRLGKSLESMTYEELLAFYTSRMEPTLNSQHRPLARSPSSSVDSRSAFHRQSSSNVPKTLDHNTFVRIDHPGQALQLKIDVLFIRALSSWLHRDYVAMAVVAASALENSIRLQSPSYVSRSFFYLAVASYGRSDWIGGDTFFIRCKNGTLKGCIEESWIGLVRDASLYERKLGTVDKRESRRGGNEKMKEKLGDAGQNDEKEGSDAKALSSKPTISKTLLKGKTQSSTVGEVKSSNSSKLLQDLSTRAALQEPGFQSKEPSLDAPSPAIWREPSLEPSRPASLGSAAIPGRHWAEGSSKSASNSAYFRSGGIGFGGLSRRQSSLLARSTKVTALGNELDGMEEDDEVYDYEDYEDA